jgi:hypothetical protein
LGARGTVGRENGERGAAFTEVAGAGLHNDDPGRSSLMNYRQLFSSTLLLMLAGTTALCGCSAFKSSKRMDMAPFSENTGVLFAEASQVSRQFEFKYLRPYLSTPEVQDLRVKALPILIALRGVVYYSNQVVAINNSKLSDKEKNEHLARYLSEIMEKAKAKRSSEGLGFDEAAAQTVLENVRVGKTYLDGIAAASPIVNAVVAAIMEQLDEFQQATIPTAVSALDKEIETTVAETRANYSNLKTLQMRSMRAANLFYQVRMGDAGELNALLEEDPSVKEFIPSPEKATAKTMDAAEGYLLDRLDKVDRMIHQLDADMAQYNAMRDELETWRITVDDKVKVARNAIMIWGQSHRNLGVGIPVPPLIDVEGLAGSALGTAKKAVF